MTITAKDYERVRGLGIENFRRNPRAGGRSRSDRPPHDLSTRTEERAHGLRRLAVHPGERRLPLTILDHKGKVASRDYFILNPVGLVDALDREASEPGYHVADRELIFRVARTVLDPRRLDPERRVFRLAGLRLPVLVERPLAEAMKAAGLVGPWFRELSDLRR